MGRGASINNGFKKTSFKFTTHTYTWLHSPQHCIFGLAGTSGVALELSNYLKVIDNQAKAQSNSVQTTTATNLTG